MHYFPIFLPLHRRKKAADVSDVPVFPLVGSTRMVFPGVISPRFSASSIIESAIRSLTELAGLLDSSLATTSATHPSPSTFEIFTSGVLPINSKIFSAILGFPACRALVDEDARSMGLGVKAVEVLLQSRRSDAINTLIVQSLTPWKDERWDVLRKRSRFGYEHLVRTFGEKEEPAQFSYAQSYETVAMCSKDRSSLSLSGPPLHNWAGTATARVLRLLFFVATTKNKTKTTFHTPRGLPLSPGWTNGALKSQLP